MGIFPSISCTINRTSHKSLPRAPRLSIACCRASQEVLHGEGSGRSDRNSWKILGNIWEICGKHIGNIWETSGTHIGNIWKTYRKHIGNIWETSGKHLGHI